MTDNSLASPSRSRDGNSPSQDQTVFSSQDAAPPKRSISDSAHKIWSNIWSCILHKEDDNGNNTEDIVNDNGNDTEDTVDIVNDNGNDTEDTEDINNIFKDDNGNDTEDIVNDIFQLLDLIHQGEPTTSHGDCWPARLSPLFEILLTGGKKMSRPSGSVNELTDVMGEVVSVLEDIGGASFVTAGFSVVAFCLKRFQDVSKNQEECLSILEEMNNLNKFVRQCTERDKLKEGMQQQIKSATTMIMKGSIMCLHQISSSPFYKFLITNNNKEDLGGLRKELIDQYWKINLQMGICIFDANQCKEKTRLSRKYPDHAVGIDKPKNDVTNLLEWGSAKKAVAVILYGFGGMGKTTVADAVFNAVNIKKIDGDECKYSHVELFKSIESSPDVINLQKKILEDLNGRETIPEIRKYQDGQREIGKMLEKVAAFIYIDNVLEKDMLRQLLPLNFDNAKKVRLLITARDIDVRKACQMTTPPKEYLMRGISSTDAMSLLEKQLPVSAKTLLANEMPGNKEGILNSNQVERIIDKCGGIPFMLNSVIQELSASKNKKEVCDVLEELETMEGEEFGVKLEYCFFIYDKLPKESREAFLDICSFFQGWDWDLVADIVGKAALERLERRALVVKGTHGVVTVHDVILEVGRRMAKAMRVGFPERSELVNFLQDNEKVEQLRYLSYKPAKDLDQLIKHNLKMPPNLKYMEIDGKLHCDALELFPASLLRLPDLRILRLINFLGLKELPSVLGHLVKGLRELTLSNCKSVMELPYSFSKLRSLRVLKMDHCESLTQLPKDFETLNSLEILSIRNCNNLKVLPDNFEELSSLRELNLSSCKGLEHLPVGLGKITSLVRLDVSRCDSLDGIPESIGELKSLLSMNISRFSKLKKLPNEFCSLSITSLKLTGCTALEELPDGFGQLESLRVLKLKSCTRLKTLPEGFSELKYLEHLDLSGCSELQELCTNFNDLLSLRTLTLDGCKKLRKLPENFHRLDSLQHLNLSNCEVLEGESMNNVVEAKALQMVYIRNSDNLKDKWRKMQGMPDQSRFFNVDIGQELCQQEKENEWEKRSSAFGNLLQNAQGQPFHLSKCSPDTILLVMFDGSPDFKPDFPWPLIEETIDDVRINFEIVYIGKHFNKLPKTVAGRISGRALDNSDARLLLEKVFFTLKVNGESLWHQKMNKFFSMSTKIVRKRHCEENGDNYYLSCWKLLSDCQMEEYVLDNCGRFLWLKQLAALRQENSIRFLAELFVNMGEDHCLLRKSDKVGLDELKSKTILLEIRPADASYGIRLQPLEKLYEKERSNLEIISIPIGKPNIKFEQFSGNIPWLVLQNAWTITRAEKYFLIKESRNWKDKDHKWYPSSFMKIERNTKVTPMPVLSMLERWGPKVYPFSDEKIKELREEEWNQRKDMSSLKFILKPLMGELHQLKEVMLQRKMICLVCDGKHPKTQKVRTKTFVDCIGSAMEEVMEMIQFIYVPPSKETKQEKSTVTDGIEVEYFPLEEPTTQELKLPHPLSLAQSAIRMRVCDLREEIVKIDENDEQLHGMKIILDFLDAKYLSMVIIDEDGEVITTKGREIVEMFENKKEKAADKRSSKEIGQGPNSEMRNMSDMIKRMIKGSSKEERKEASLQLESLL